MIVLPNIIGKYDDAVNSQHICLNYSGVDMFTSEVKIHKDQEAT